MTIDIIDLEDPDYADLNAVQLAMVRAAQRKKDEAVAEAEEEKERLEQLLIANNFYRSSIMEYAEDRIDGETEEKVAVIRDDLLYQLAYEGLASEGDENGPYRYPENPNYNLSPSQRFLVVRNYYMEATPRRAPAGIFDGLARAAVPGRILHHALRSAGVLLLIGKKRSPRQTSGAAAICCLPHTGGASPKKL